VKRPFRRKRLDRFLRRDLKAGELLGLSQEDGEELLVEAARRYEAGEVDSAFTLFVLHLRCFGPNADALLGTGACEQSKGRLEAAEQTYSSALKERPGDPFAWANLAECALLRKDPERALKILASLVQEGTKVPAELTARLRLLEQVANEASRVGTPPIRSRESETTSSGNELSDVAFATEPDLKAVEFRSILRRSTLGERRPMCEPNSIEGMLENAGVIVTARIEGLLVGVSRAITDGHFCTYLSDLAVDSDYQRRGIGRELIRRTHEAAGLNTTLILLAAPAAREYYPHIGMQAHDSCWIIPRTSPLPGTAR
jgi:ribosomal protein S18 acetylase RimI-like enzyme